MTYNQRLKKAVFDREHGLIKVFVFGDEPYADLVKRCASRVFPDSSDSDSEFFLSDASGCRIGCDELMIMETDGTLKAVTWSLAHYFNVKRTRYPNKLKFAIVKKDPKIEGT